MKAIITICNCYSRISINGTLVYRIKYASSGESITVYLISDQYPSCDHLYYGRHAIGEVGKAEYETTGKYPVCPWATSNYIRQAIRLVILLCMRERVDRRESG